MRPEKASNNLEEYQVVIFEKSETERSFSISAEINGEIVGHTFPKNDKWLSEYNGSPGYIWKLRDKYEKKYEAENDEKIDLGRY